MGFDTREALDIAFGPNDKVRCEIPSDGGNNTFPLEVFINLGCPRTIHIDLVHHSELYALLLGKALNCGTLLRFLRSELIAWKCNNLNDSGILELIVQGHQAIVVRFSVTTIRGHIDNDRDLSFEFCEVDHDSIDVVRFEIEEGCDILCAESGNMMNIERDIQCNGLGTKHAQSKEARR